MAQATQATAEAKALADVAAARAEAKVALQAAREEDKKAAEDEFAAGFFQGYSDLKRRVAEDHLEWDLAGYSGIDSDYWEAEASEAGGDTPVEEGVGSVDAGEAARDATGLGEQETPAGDTEQVVQIVDNVPIA